MFAAAAAAAAHDDRGDCDTAAASDLEAAAECVVRGADARWRDAQVQALRHALPQWPQPLCAIVASLLPPSLLT